MYSLAIFLVLSDPLMQIPKRHPGTLHPFKQSKAEQTFRYEMTASFAKIVSQKAERRITSSLNGQMTIELIFI